MKITDFIDKYYYEMSVRLRKILFSTCDRYLYIHQIDYQVLKKFRNCGNGTANEFVRLMNKIEKQEKKVNLLFEVDKPKEIETPTHYDNTKDSLYQFCENQQLNAYEFDIIKRVMRCRKKGNFREDLEKTKFLIDLYIKEYDNKARN